jgi:hypothetical protein
MHLGHDLIDALFAAHGVHAPWTALTATGVVNRIFATPDVVLRVAATDHSDADVPTRGSVTSAEGLFVRDPPPSRIRVTSAASTTIQR